MLPPIPFELRGDLVVVEGEAAGVAASFVVDTGCGLTALDAAWAAAHGVQPDDGPAIRAEGTATVSARLATTSFRLGDIASTAQKVVLVDLTAVAKRFGFPIDGIIGFDFFSRGLVDIDFRARTLSIIDSLDAGGIVIPVDLTYRIPIATATVVAAPGVELTARLAIDLGSTRLDVRLLGAFVDTHAEVLDALEREAGEFGTGVGGAIEGHVTRLREVRLGGLTLTAPSTGIARGREGVLGLGVIDGTVGSTVFHDRRLILDYARRQVIVR